MTDADFAQLFALSQAAPGPNVLIVSLIGWKVAGVAGGVVAMLAMSGPSSLLTYCGRARLGALSRRAVADRDPARARAGHRRPHPRLGLRAHAHRRSTLDRVRDHRRDARAVRSRLACTRCGCSASPRFSGASVSSSRVAPCPSCPTSSSTSRASRGASSGSALERVRLLNPFRAAHRGAADRRRRGQASVDGVRRLGKRIVLALEGDLFLVLHLMIAGRLRWLETRRKAAGAHHAGRCSTSPTGTLAFTEAGTKRRASLHLVQGEAALARARPGRPRRAVDDRRETFRERAAAREPHAQARADRSAALQRHRQRVLRRDPASRAAVADRADAQARRRGDRAPLRGRARGRSPNGPSGCAPKPAADFPRESPRSAPRWRCTGGSGSRVRCAARRCSASSTPRTRPTIARAARPAARFSPTARCRGCSRSSWPRIDRRVRVI